MTYEQVQNYLRHEAGKAERASAMVDAMLKAQAAAPIARMAERIQRMKPEDWIKFTWSSISTKTAPAAKPVQVQAEPVQVEPVKPSALPTTREIAAALRARAVAYRHAGYSLAELCRSARLNKNSWCELARIAKGVRKGGLNTLTVDRLSAALTARGF